MSPTLIVLAAGGGVLVALLVAVLVARRLIAAGNPWSRAFAVEAVAAIGCIGAVQSYTALRGLALQGDLPDWLAAVAPATVDLFAPVMGLAALQARSSGERDHYAEYLALGYSLAAVAANLGAAVLDASTHSGIKVAQVALVVVWHTAPVITFLFGSHWLMRRHALGRPSDGADVAAAELAAARTALEAERRAAADLRLELAEARQDGGQAGEPVEDEGDGRADDVSEAVRNPQPRVPARAEVQRLLADHSGDLSEDDIRRLAVRVARRTGVTNERARRLLREEQERSKTGRRPHLVQMEAAAPAAAAAVEEA